MVRGNTLLESDLYIEPENETRKKRERLRVMDRVQRNPLNYNLVSKIKAALLRGESQKQIADRYSTTRTNVTLINTGRRWSWVEPAETV